MSNADDAGKLIEKWLSADPSRAGRLLEVVAKKRADVWMRLNRKVRGKPYTFVDYSDPFRHRPFLVHPLTYPARYKTALKPRQIGFTDIFGCGELLFNCEAYPGSKYFYVFPRLLHVRRFSTSRLTPAIEGSDRLRAKLDKTVNNVEQKKIGDSFIFLSSGWSAELGEGVDADGVYFDEKDRMRDGIEDAFRESLSSSPQGIIRDITTPTIPNRGVHATYLKSTQFNWFVACKSCGYKQVITVDNVLEVKKVPIGSTQVPAGSYEYRCIRCKDGKLDRMHGEWVPAHPQRDIAGWALSQLMCGWISADSIMQKKMDARYLELWYRYVIGVPYEGSGRLARESDIMGCALDPTFTAFVNRRPQGIVFVSAGIDWGNINWVSVRGMSSSGRWYLLALDFFEDTQEPLGQAKAIAKYLRDNWAPDIIVADLGYGKEKNAYLLNQFGDKFWSCHYPNSDESSTLVEPKWDTARHVVTAPRTMTLKQTSQNYVDRAIVVPKPPGQHVDDKMALFIKHFENCHLVYEEDEGSISQTVYSAGPDHLAHADNYARIGGDRAKKRTQSSMELIG